MGALLSQAVANQLRQVPGFMDPHPTPGTLLQQVLNPPGPSRPLWQAPVMENQQMLAESMDPSTAPAYRQALNQALAKNATAAAIAFGGADITKEDKIKRLKEWELDQYTRSSRGEEPLPRIPAGTKVTLAGSKESEAGYGIVVDPTDENAVRAAREGPGYQAQVTPNIVLVKRFDPQAKGGPYEYIWMHRKYLEVAPPDFLYRSTHPSILMDQIRHHTHLFYEDPELAEKHRITVGDFGVNEPPIMTRIPRDSVKWAYAQGSRRVVEETGRAHPNPWRATDEKLPVDQIQVEVKDGVWIPLTEWIKTGGKK